MMMPDGDSDAVPLSYDLNAIHEVHGHRNTLPIA
jgi:hypothetical protein